MPCARGARLVRCLLGESAISGKKSQQGNPLVILGIEVTLSSTGACYRPEDAKLAEWSAQIERILSEGVLCGGEASKLAGKLQWGVQHTFRRLGRAMIGPIFKCVALPHTPLHMASCTSVVPGT